MKIFPSTDSPIIAEASYDTRVVNDMHPGVHSNTSTFLPSSFSPSNFDVILGRKKKWQSHAGNQRLRLIVAANLEAYKAAQTRSEKTRILSSVVDQVRKFTPKGNFVKLDDSTGLWFDVGNVLAREKVSQTFRDALCDTYKSSNEYKKKKRQEEGEKKNIGNTSVLHWKKTSSNSKMNSISTDPKSQNVAAGKSQAFAETPFFLADSFPNVEFPPVEPNLCAKVCVTHEDVISSEIDSNLFAFLQDINFLENWDTPDSCESSNMMISPPVLSSNGC